MDKIKIRKKQDFKTLLLFFSCLISTLFLTGSAKAEIMGISLPTQGQEFFYAAVSDPVVSTIPAGAKPIGVGAVAIGGSTAGVKVDIQLSTNYMFDVYFGGTLPNDPNFYYFNGSEFVTSATHLRWMSGVNGRITKTFFQNINLADISKGEYTFYLGVSPVNDQSKYYIWYTKFNNNYSSGSICVPACLSDQTCVGGSCRQGICGDGKCNDCSNAFSPCTSETSSSCPRDCGSTNTGAGGQCVPVSVSND